MATVMKKMCIYIEACQTSVYGAGFICSPGNQGWQCFVGLVLISCDCYITVCLSRRSWAMCLWCQRQLGHRAVHLSFHHRHHPDCHGPMPGPPRLTEETLKRSWETFIESWSLKVMAKDQENSSKNSALIFKEFSLVIKIVNLHTQS